MKILLPSIRKILLFRNFLLVLGLGAVTSGLHADNVFWTGTDGNWTDTTWTDGNPPTASDRAIINNGGEVTVNTSDPVSDDFWLSGTILSGVVIENGGLLTTTQGTVGLNKNESGYLTIENGGKWSTGTATVGRNGTGTMTIEAGGTMEASGNVLIGDPNFVDNSSEGLIKVSGTMNVGGTLFVGNAAKGTLEIDGGHVTSSGVGNVGTLAGDVNGDRRGEGLVSVTNGKWTTSSFRVGSGGTGTLNILNGGSVDIDSLSYIGYASTGTGTVFVGEGGKLNLVGVGKDLVVGRDGVGALTVSGSGQVNNVRTIYLGYSASAKGGDLNIGAAVGDTAAAPGTISAQVVNAASSAPDGKARLNFNHTGTNYAFNPDVNITNKVQVNAYAGTTILGRAAGYTYTGGTVIHGGTLLINNTSGSGTGTGAVEITGGTLGGDGSISGDLLLKTGGKIAPGAAPGSVGDLTGTNLTWDGGGQMVFELGATESLSDTDRLTLSGTLTKGSATGGGWTFVFSDSLANPVTIGETYTLLTFASSTGFDVGDFSSDYQGVSQPGLAGEFILNATNLQFSVNVIPEPGTAGLLLLGGVVVLLARRKRQRK